MTGARWTNGILAVWIIISPFLGFTSVGNILNAVTVGTVVAGVGIALIQASRWQGWAATLGGLWLVTAMLLPPLRTGAGLLWNSLLVGGIVLVASIPLTGRKKHEGVEVEQVRHPVPPEQKPRGDEAWSDEADRGARELLHH